MKKGLILGVMVCALFARAAAGTTAGRVPAGCSHPAGKTGIWEARRCGKDKGQTGRLGSSHSG
jgi:hypothetical protein